jgi:hypothetical protein
MDAQSASASTIAEVSLIADIASLDVCLHPP